MTRLVIGAPVLGKDSANQQAKEAFGGAEYPLSVTVTNKMTVTLSLPEAGVKLRPLASGVATFRNFDRLQRAVSSMEQIARLNDAKALVELEVGEGDGDGDGDAKESAEGGETPAKKDEDGAGSGDPEVTVVQDDEQAFVVELQGVRFEPNRNQVREDGTLTAGGLKAFDEAKAAAEAAE